MAKTEVMGLIDATSAQLSALTGIDPDQLAASTRRILLPLYDDITLGYDGGYVA